MPLFYERLRQSFLNVGINPDDPETGLRDYYAGGNIIRTRDPQYSINPFLHEVPSHLVVVDLPIAMGRTEVTREEWAACVADGGCEAGQVIFPRRSISVARETRTVFRTQIHASGFDFSTIHIPFTPRDPITGVTYPEMNDYVAWLNEKVGANIYRIPTEAEWEYAARAGTTTRFAQGETLSLSQANIALFRLSLVDGTYVREYDPENAR